MDIIETIDTYLRENHISRSDLARKMGVERSVITRMLNDRSRDINVNTLIKVCKALDLTLMIVSNNKFNKIK